MSLLLQILAVVSFIFGFYLLFKGMMGRTPLRRGAFYVFFSIVLLFGLIPSLIAVSDEMSHQGWTNSIFGWFILVPYSAILAVVVAVGTYYRR